MDSGGKSVPVRGNSKYKDPEKKGPGVVKE